VERITDAFTWPVRDPEWLSKLLIIALILLIPVVGAINAIGWMLASLDRLRAGEERLAPANLSHLGRGVRLFVVDLVYELVLILVGAVLYVPAVLIFAHEGTGTASAGLVSVAVLLSLLTFSVVTLGSLALNFAMPSIVLVTDHGGIGAGLKVGDVLRRARLSMVNTLIAGLMLIAAGFIGSLGTVACGIGVLFTTAYATAMQAWIIRSFEVGSHPAGTA
jgi:Protein of unknown function (DUF4013)